MKPIAEALEEVLDLHSNAVSNFSAGWPREDFEDLYSELDKDNIKQFESAKASFIARMEGLEKELKLIKDNFCHFEDMSVEEYDKIRDSLTPPSKEES